MLKNTVYCLMLLLVLQGCQKDQGINYDVIYVKYTDSTFQNPIDSFCVSDNDTIYSNSFFALDGYFKVYRWERADVEQGLFRQNKMMGNWLYYSRNTDSIYQLYKSENYNIEGDLDGDFITYYSGGKDIEEYYQFKNGYQTGVQKQLYPSGALFYQYQTDTLGNYINGYVVFKENRDTIYYENFGVEGTGCVKKFSIDGHLQWERNITNKTIEGWEIEYGQSSEGRNITWHKILYHNNEILRRIEFFGAEEYLLKDVYIDSITQEYSTNEILIKYYGKNGKVIQQQKQALD